MNLISTKGELPGSFHYFFNSNDCDIFHLPVLLNEIYGSEWYSILISEDLDALFHVFSPNRIGNSEYFDIEPFLGYNGFILNNKDLSENFVSRALNLYTEHCRKNMIVAEIVRFNPVLNNQFSFLGNNYFHALDPVKEIVVSNCFKDKDLQISEFSKSRRRDIKTASKLLMVERQKSPFSYTEFYKYYIDSLKRNFAKKEWYFQESFFSNISKNSVFYLFKAIDNDNRIHSCSLFILHKLCSYYFLAANNPPILPGANDLLIMEMCRFAAEMGCEKLILGGGNTTKKDDPLLLYKKKFSKQDYFLYLGKIVHNKEIFESLCSNIVVKNPELASSNFFLKYRL